MGCINVCVYKQQVCLRANMDNTIDYGHIYLCWLCNELHFWKECCFHFFRTVMLSLCKTLLLSLKSQASHSFCMERRKGLSKAVKQIENWRGKPKNEGRFELLQGLKGKWFFLLISSNFLFLCVSILFELFSLLILVCLCSVQQNGAFLNIITSHSYFMFVVVFFCQQSYVMYASNSLLPLHYTYYHAITWAKNIWRACPF